MWSYNAKVGRDITRWHQAGWITDDGAKAIANELAATRSGVTPSSILAISGVVLLGFGAMSFVAANWQDIPKLARLLMLFSFSVASYVTAGALIDRNQGLFSHAAVLLGVALFGANIMLIAQMYHVAGRPNDMVLIWTLIAFLSGIAFKSGPVTSLSLLLMTLWSGWESSDAGAIHWPFVPAWIIISAALYWQRAAFGLYIAGATMTLWLISLAYPWWGGDTTHWVPLGIGLIAAAACIFAQHSNDQSFSRLGRVGFGFSLLVIIAALSGLQYLPKGDFGTGSEVSLTWYILLSAIKLGVLIAAIWWCVERANNGVLWLAYLLFSLAVLAIYFKTVGSLLGSSVFFVLAGLIVIALAWSAHLLRTRTAPAHEAQQ